MNPSSTSGAPEYKVIYVEDHKILRKMMCTNINHFKEFKVTAEADNGQQLIELMKAGAEAQLVILDLNMPVLNGYDTAIWLKKNHPEIKILVITSFENIMVKAEAIRCGADAVISKNTDMKHLYEVMKQLVAGSL